MYEKPFNPFAKNLAIVKDYFKSGSVLVLAILKTIGIALSFPLAILSVAIAPLLLSISASSFYQSLTGLDAETARVMREIYDWIMGFVNSALISQSTAQSISGNLPSITTAVLVVVALFIIYFASKNPSPESSPKAGVVILHVLAIIEVVVTWIILVCCVLVNIFLYWLYAALNGVNGTVSSIEAPMFLSGPVELPTPIDAVFLRVFVLVLAITLSVSILIGGFFALFTAINKKRFFRSVKKSISEPNLETQGARPYGVMCVIGAVFAGTGLLSIPTGIIQAITIGDGSYSIFMIVSGVASIVSFLVLVFEAKIALGYKKYIDNKKFGYSEPVAPAAPYAPFPYGQPGPAPQNPYTQAPARPNPTNPYADPFTTAPAPTAGPVCPHCGAKVDAAAPFCGNCGGKL